MALKHTAPAEVVDLRPLRSQFSETKTHAIVRASQFEAIRLVLPAGIEIPSHSVAGPITLYCIEGHAQLDVDGAPVEMRAGDWLYLEGGMPHSVKGVENTSMLLTILFVDIDLPPV